MFATVEFLDEGSMATVPKEWLEMENEKHGQCWWPSFRQTEKAKCRCPVEKESWSRFPVRVFKYADDCVTADRFTGYYMVESDVDIQAYSNKRIVRKPTRFCATDSEPCSAEGSLDNPVHSPSPTTSNTLPMPPTYSAPRRERSCTITAAKKGIEDPRSKSCSGFSPPARSYGSDFEPASINEELSYSQEFESKVLMELSQIKSHLQHQISILKDLTKSDPAVDLGDIPIQMNSPEELEEFCKKLLENTFKKKMVRYLSTIGGKDVGCCVRNIMSTIGTNKLWMKYSLRGMGRLNKRNFEKLPICDVIIRACQKTRSEWKVTAIKEAIGNKLKYSKIVKEPTMNDESSD